MVCSPHTGGSTNDSQPPAPEALIPRPMMSQLTPFQAESLCKTEHVCLSPIRGQIGAAVRLCGAAHAAGWAHQVQYPRDHNPSFLIIAHHATVASDISRKDGNQPSFDTRLGHGRPSIGT